MAYKLSPHARHRMITRQIPESVIEAAIKCGDTHKCGKGRTMYVYNKKARRRSRFNPETHRDLGVIMDAHGKVITIVPADMSNSKHRNFFFKNRK